jgi:hypothetical protein
VLQFSSQPSSGIQSDETFFTYASFTISIPFAKVPLTRRRVVKFEVLALKFGDKKVLARLAWATLKVLCSGVEV